MDSMATMYGFSLGRRIHKTSEHSQRLRTLSTPTATDKTKTKPRAKEKPHSPQWTRRAKTSPGLIRDHKSRIMFWSCPFHGNGSKDSMATMYGFSLGRRIHKTSEHSQRLRTLSTPTATDKTKTKPTTKRKPKTTLRCASLTQGVPPQWLPNGLNGIQSKNIFWVANTHKLWNIVNG
jgi:hypothetical protein